VLKRILAVFHARNLEFMRDRASLGWNIILPVALVFGLGFIFADGDRSQFTVGVLTDADAIDMQSHPFLETRFLRFVPQADRAAALRKISRHQLDLLVSLSPETRYWVNPQSPKGYIVERLLLASSPGVPVREAVSGDAIRYVDWLLPGVLGMNMMFSCLFGVGYVVVRYRKNGFLKRLKATPLRAIEFVIAQVASRLILILVITVFVYVGTSALLDIRMDGSYLALFVIAVFGAIALISMGLLVAARVSSEELAGGLLNMVTWPMMLVSGVWFSLEGANPAIRRLAEFLPLTQILDAARTVMLDGGGLPEVANQLAALSVMTLVFLAISAWLFRWRQP
jgi:ABC-type multidrug transport system permease subunit